MGMIVTTQPNALPIKSFIANDRGEQIVPLELAAERQLQNIASLPFIHHHIAAMPDVHLGIGATVGSVVPTTNAIIPAAVGVDIGCGMSAQCTFLKDSDLPDSLAALRSAIEAAVPHGRTNDGRPGDKGAWSNISHLQSTETLAHLLRDIEGVAKEHAKLAKAIERCPHHAGTLGTGNHFIEICVDSTGLVWILLHSGSRGVGNAIGTYFIGKAKEEMERRHIDLPDKDLAYLPDDTPLFKDYWKAVEWAQRFARFNRAQFMRAVQRALMSIVPRYAETAGEHSYIDCHHNYVAEEHHFGKNVYVTRKGAVRARVGDVGIIPGSMGTRSYIVRGKGNPDSFESCSHGAGRRMSRTQARKTFSLEDHAKATRGVECRKDKDVIDETPGAYKDIDTVMEAQRELVEVVHTLKAVICVKG